MEETMHSFYDFLAGLFLLGLFIVNLICLIVLPIAIIRHLFFPLKRKEDKKDGVGATTCLVTNSAPSEAARTGT